MYTIDLDKNYKWKLDNAMKSLLASSCIKELKYRKSSSKKGYHIKWFCSKQYCKQCNHIKKTYDDKFRYFADLKYRKPYQRNVLFTEKNGVKAGDWKIWK